MEVFVEVDSLVQNQQHGLTHPGVTRWSPHVVSEVHVQVHDVHVHVHVHCVCVVMCAVEDSILLLAN